MHRRIASVGAALLVAAILAAVAFALSISPPPRARALATIWYVDDDSCPATGSGTTAAPFCRIQQAVNAAAGGDEIRKAAGIGSALGGVVLGVWGRFRRRVVTQMVALVVDGLVIIAIGLSPRDPFLLAVILVAVSGLLEAVAVGVGGAVAQAIIPPEVQGRVFALLMSASQALAPLGLLVAGPTADALGVGFWWVLTGIVITTMGAGALFVPDIVRIEDRAAGHLANAAR